MKFKAPFVRLNFAGGNHLDIIEELPTDNVDSARSYYADCVITIDERGILNLKANAGVFRGFYRTDSSWYSPKHITRPLELYGPRGMEADFGYDDIQSRNTKIIKEGFIGFRKKVEVYYGQQVAIREFDKEVNLYFTNWSLQSNEMELASD